MPLLWSGLWRKPGRTVLALVQILVAFALFGLLQGFASGIKHAVDHIGADVLSVHSRGSMADLPLADFERIKRVPGVKLVNLANYFNATYQNPKQQLLIVATDAHAWPAMTDNIVVPPTYMDALANTRTGAIVGDELVRKYGWKIGQRISLQTHVAQQNGSTDWAFDIVGILKMRDAEMVHHSTFMMVNYGYYDAARAADRGMVQQYMLRVADPKQAGAVADAIDALFANSPNETRTESLKEMAQSQMRSLGDVNFVVRAITAAVLFSLLFSIGAAQMQSVRERTPELAVLKTIGFSDGAIVALLVGEALSLCLVAAGLGLALAAALFWVAVRVDFFRDPLPIPVAVLAAGAGLALLLALITAALPAWRSLKLEVAEALAGR
jgi:putative ABC transport system permease protein